MASQEDVHKCCKSGHIHTGTPTGTMTRICGLETYVATAHPKKSSSSSSSATTIGEQRTAVLFLHDAFGLPFINNQLLADTYAEQAQVDVYLPDFLEGDSVPVSILSDPDRRAAYDFGAWAARHSRPHCSHMIESFCRELRENHGVQKLAAVGFCWGGWAALHLGATDLVDAVVVHHPSLLNIPDDVQNLKKPSMFLCAETDHQLPEDKRTTVQQILEQKDIESVFKVYPGTLHGFAVRFNGTDTIAAEAAEDAKNMSIEFFKTHLA